MKVDVSNCPSSHTVRNKIGRALWQIVWAILYRPSPKILHGWRRFLLRSFGAQISPTAFPHASAKIWAPWNLTMDDYSCLAQDVDCYCVDRIVIGAHATVSQYSFLCAASHDYSHPSMPLVTAPILIGDGAWVAADVFVGPGVVVGEGAVIGARSSVYKHVEPWSVVAGNPAKFLKKRTLSVEETETRQQVSTGASGMDHRSGAAGTPAPLCGQPVGGPFQRHPASTVRAD